MVAQGESTTERLLRQSLLAAFVPSGVVVLSGFFFPWFVGSVVSGQGWLVLSLLFFGSGLSYLALLPADEGGEAERDPTPDAPYLLRVRHFGVVNTLRSFLARQDPVAFGVPVAGLALFFLARVLVPTETVTAVGVLRGVLLEDLAWVFLGSVFLAVLFALWLLWGPWGSIRLGGADAEPTYTYPTYFSLFFTAGIAAGIVFWGPAEALFHYRTPPPYFGGAPASAGAVPGALTYALFHWGVSAWSAYLVIGVPIAYFVHQRGAPLRVSTILTPFLGEGDLDSPWRTLVDVLAVFATLGGLGTSVALVSQQFLTGINYQWDVTYGFLAPIVLVAGLAAIYVISAVSGVHRGIRRIAAVTTVLFGLFTLLVFGLGPRGFVVDQGSVAVGSYLRHFVPMSLLSGGAWGAEWTVWNWSWWFSWAPFAGLFLAAISKGRTIRTVVVTGVFATSAATGVWFLVMGGTSLFYQHRTGTDVLGTMESHAATEAVAGFPLFAALGMSQLLVFLFLALIVVFITTSAAVSTLVVAILATKREYAPTTGSIVFWGVLQGVVAVAVLLVDGGESLQTMAVLTGGPFALLAVLALAGLSVTLYRSERGHRSLPDEARAALAERDVTLLPERPDLRDDERE